MCAGRFVHNRVEGKMLRHSCSLLRALQEYLVLASILRASRAIQSQYLDRKIQGACIAPPTDRLELHPTQPPSHLPRQPYLELRNLPPHPSDSQLLCPACSVCDRHPFGCKFSDGLSSNFKQPICVVERSQSVFGFHGRTLLENSTRDHGWSPRVSRTPAHDQELTMNCIGDRIVSPACGLVRTLPISSPANH